MIKAVFSAMSLVGAASTLAGAAPAQSGEPVTLTSNPHWEPAFVRQYTQEVQCRRSGKRGSITFVLDSSSADAVFYSVVSIRVREWQVEATAIAQVNSGIREYRHMPTVSLQCAGEDFRIALVGEGRTGGRELIVPLEREGAAPAR